MVKIYLILIFGILEVRSRSNDVRVGQNMRNHGAKNNGNSPSNEFLKDRSFATLKLLDHVLQMIKKQNEISSNVMESEDKQNAINSHNLSKRSPGCILWCLKRGILHPAQCHSFCRF